MVKTTLRYTHRALPPCTAVTKHRQPCKMKFICAGEDEWWAYMVSALRLMK